MNSIKSVSIKQSENSGEIQFKALSEGDLVASAKQGDLDAINKLMQIYRVRIYAFITARGVKLHHDVEDLVQETFIQIFKSICTFEHRAKFSSWVMGIALNIVRNHINRSAQYRYDFVDTADTVLPDNSAYSEPHKTVESAQTYEGVKGFIKELPQSLQDCVRYICIEGHSYQSTAEQFNISSSCLKSRLFRARNELKKRMDECGYMLA